ncbi:MAG: hypothetical protein Q4C43_02900 [Prevotella sp.]|nr:hypothetical protein [Prevotella sp.]
MTKNFNFDNIGKRLPYTMPPDTFNKMEADVFAALKQDKRSRKSYRIIRWGSIAGIAVAASVALLLTIAPTMTVQDDLLTQIDLAYANLSETDQDFLIEISQEDIFLNQEQE